MFSTFSQKITLGWHLMKTAFFYISRDAELFWYSFLSMIITFFVLGMMIIALFIAGVLNADMLDNLSETSFQIILFVIAAIFYLISAFISYFFRTAIATSIERRLAGEDNSFMDGIRSAWQRLGKIFIWSLLESTVFLIIDQIYKFFETKPFIGKIIQNMFIAAWNIMTYFSFPLMILTKRGVKDSLKTSAELFTKTWGERATIYIGISLISTIIGAIAFIASFAMALGVMAQTQNFLWAFAIMGVLYVFLVVINLIARTCDTIIRVLLLYYVMSGKLPEKLDANDVAQMTALK